MTTSIYELANSLDERLDEVNILLDKAEENKDNEKLYGALCRSSSVLLVAHFEGFIKECVRAIIDDLNSYSVFNKLPENIKRTFCTLFISGDDQSSNEKRIQKLIEVFDSMDTKLRVEAFLLENNKNPSPSIVEKICKNFGIRDFFRLLEHSRLDEVFKENKSDNAELLKELREQVLSSIANYPYKSDPTIFGISADDKFNRGARTLWETFLDELLKNRHSIAHGSSMLNIHSPEEIQVQKTKLEILQFAIILVLTNKFAN